MVLKSKVCLCKYKKMHQNVKIPISVCLYCCIHVLNVTSCAYFPIWVGINDEKIGIFVKYFCLQFESTPEHWQIYIRLNCCLVTPLIFFFLIGMPFLWLHLEYWIHLGSAQGERRMAGERKEREAKCGGGIHLESLKHLLWLKSN